MATYYEEGVCSYVELPPSELTKLNKRVNDLSSKVTNITPYEDSKTAYIGDTEIIFDRVKGGNINTYCITESGNAINTMFEVLESEIVVSFEPLEEVSIVSISIQ